MQHKFTFAGAIAGKFAVIAMLAASVSACVSPGPIRVSTVCGQKVVYHPDDLKPCHGGASACTVRDGVETQYQIYYSTLDESVLGHEEEHVCGMRHREPWVTVAGKICTVVTEGGNTPWKKGDVMCRVDAGPPIRITDARIRAYTMNN
ncbi:MAG TPA: hypothetical protein VGN52_09560 [Burkholderiales bacterium]|jgi:hypothetical protein